MEELSDVRIFGSDSLLETIRKRPGMYLGRPSLTAFYYYISGYEAAFRGTASQKPPQIPLHFSDWVSYRLHLGSSQAPYHLRILKRVRDEAAALNRFFELYDEFLTRVPRIVATIRKDRGEYTVLNYQSQEPGLNSRPLTNADEMWVKNAYCAEGFRYVRNLEVLPETLKLVVYNDTDPGFFVTTDESEHGSFFWRDRFFECLDDAAGFAHIKPDMLHIEESDIYERLVRENKICRKRLASARSRIKRKESTSAH